MKLPKVSFNSTYKKLAASCSAEKFVVNEKFFSAKKISVKIANFL